MKDTQEINGVSPSGTPDHSWFLNGYQTGNQEIVVNVQFRQLFHYIIVCDPKHDGIDPLFAPELWTRHDHTQRNPGS